MKDSRLYIILLIMAAAILLATSVHSQSFYSSRYKDGNAKQLNNKTVMQKKQLNMYQTHSSLYKIRRQIAHSKKRRNFKKGKVI